MTIADRIRIARKNKGLSQVELAEKAGINRKSLSRYELGTTVPPADALKVIADTLGVSADMLLSDNNIQVKDKDLMKRFEAIQEMEGDTKKMVLEFLDLAIRDFKTKQTYAS